ncbi:hypothetical protein [Meiothermus taiwanensis]|uniref:hypothetical protein n=1 Tax=Meiothermus taiwanensis TaxID=172827 RepID=UPI0003F8B786
MPSAQALARQRAAQQRAVNNTADAVRFLNDHEGQPVLLRSSRIEVLARYEGLIEEDGRVEPLYALHLPSTGEWLRVAQATLDGYLNLYGPYTWEVQNA